MYPHERSLVQRFAGKPFAIVGVNSDESRATAQRLRDDGTVTWRSFWNGPEGVRGPISTAWNVREWPAVYVLDHEGVIRHRWLAAPPSAAQLDEALAPLVEAADRLSRGR